MIRALGLKVVCLVCLIGCGSGLDLASVNGAVTLDGKPLENAFVIFAPTEKGSTAYGKTDSNGKYQMMFTDKQQGAWIGNNLVRINTGDVGTGDSPGKPERVPTVYNIETKLKVEVKKGDNTFNFDLDSKAGKIGKPIVE